VTNPAGAAIVNAAGPIRQIVQASSVSQRRYLVIAPGPPGEMKARCKCRKSEESGSSGTEPEPRERRMTKAVAGGSGDPVACFGKGGDTL
jgi:hypothetical protein